MLELNVCGHTKRNRTSTGEKNKKTKNKRSEFLGSSLVMPFGRQSRGLRDREELSTVFLLWLECRLMTKGAHGST